MSLDTDVERDVKKNLRKYEGTINHLYLDTLGNVTVGVGHLIPNRTAIDSIPMYKTESGSVTDAATAEEKEDEYDKIANLSSDYKASWYREQTSLIMQDNDIETFLEEHIASFYNELTGIYRKGKDYRDDFDDFPREVQVALFDMIFNLGASKIVNVFKIFNAAIQRSDWAKAAEESNRPQLSPARNDYVKALFLSAVSSVGANVTDRR